MHSYVTVLIVKGLQLLAMADNCEVCSKASTLGAEFAVVDLSHLSKIVHMHHAGEWQRQLELPGLDSVGFGDPDAQDATPLMEEVNRLFSKQLVEKPRRNASVKTLRSTVWTGWAAEQQLWLGTRCTDNAQTTCTPACRQQKGLQQAMCYCQ